VQDLMSLLSRLSDDINGVGRDLEGKDQEQNAAVQYLQRAMVEGTSCPYYKDNWATLPPSPNWKFDIVTIRNQAIARINNPEQIYQGYSNWCGYFTTLRMLAILDPVGYAQFVHGVYCKNMFPSTASDSGFTTIDDTIDKQLYDFETKKCRLTESDMNDVTREEALIAEVDRLVVYTLNAQANVFLEAGVSFSHGLVMPRTLEHLLKMFQPKKCASVRQNSDKRVAIHNMIKMFNMNNKDSTKVRATLEKAPVILLVDPPTLWHQREDKDFFIRLFASHWVRLIDIKITFDPLPEGQKYPDENQLKFVITYSDTTRNDALEMEWPGTGTASFSEVEDLMKNILPIDVLPGVGVAVASSVFCVPAQGYCSSDPKKLSTIMCI